MAHDQYSGNFYIFIFLQSTNIILRIRIQDASEFKCQVLNRDIWSNEVVKSIIKEQFIFLQVAFLNCNESFGCHEARNGEGADFRLEEKNKHIKSWIPPGVPTVRDWVQTCRNLEDFEEASTYRIQLTYQWKSTSSDIKLLPFYGCCQ